jgi:phosphatidylserine/phosphatidylglycerophosphate/cardiolipin synthase-like enzyme
MISTSTRDAVQSRRTHVFSPFTFPYRNSEATAARPASRRRRVYIGSLQAFTFAVAILLGWPIGAAAQERLCDTQFEDCRAPLLDLIRNERVGIDVAFWFMEDSRYVPELIKRYKAGVPVRILVDQRANASKRLNEQMLKDLRDGGIPMRDKFAGDVLHFKTMLFHGQNVVEFSKANYTPFSLVADPANVNNYFDEAVFFTNDNDLTNSFRRRFDDRWINTSEFRNYGNVTGPLIRQYPMFPIHSSMNFPPLQDFATRAVARYDQEPQRLDAIVFRVTDARHADAMIRAVGRGVPVRLITEPTEYRNSKRLWMAKYVDRMWAAGVQIKVRQHEGLTHEASVIMHGLGEVIFGSSNWTPVSSDGYSDEHNYFYNPGLGKPWFFEWFADQFENKWQNTANYIPFQPLPPGSPSYTSPANLTPGVSSSATLTWDGGPWGHLYDIYLGTTPAPPLLVSNQELGSPDAGKLETYTVTSLLPGTTYYWRIVGKTWAQLANSGPTWSFTTAGTPPSGGGTPTGGTPYLGTPVAIPGTFQAENFDAGGQFVAHYDATAGNSGGAYRSTEVDIEPAGDSGGGHNVGWTRAGEWLKYSVNVAATGSYRLETRVANLGTGARLHIEVDGVDRTGPIAVPDTGGWQAWTTITTPGISLTAGQRIVRVVFDSAGSGGGAGNYNWFRFVEGTLTSPVTPTPTPFGGTPAVLPGVVQAEHFDDGGQGLAYYDASAGNSGSVYRNTDVDIAAGSDSLSPGHYVGWTRAGEWLQYTVNVTQARAYALSVRVANLGSGATFRVEVDGVDVTGPVQVPNTGGWDLWQTLPVTLTAPLSQGQRVIRLVMLTRNGENSGVGNYGYLSFQ